VCAIKSVCLVESRDDNATTHSKREDGTVNPPEVSRVDSVVL
jgi:hypothetical protein